MHRPRNLIRSAIPGFRFTMNPLKSGNKCTGRHVNFTLMPYAKHNFTELTLLRHPLVEVGNASEGLLFLRRFISCDILIAQSTFRFGASAKSVSWIGLTQLCKTLRTSRCSGMRRMCPSQLHSLSRAFNTAWTVGFLASSAMVLPVILQSILDRGNFTRRPSVVQAFKKNC